MFEHTASTLGCAPPYKALCLNPKVTALRLVAADTDQEGRLDVNADNTDGVRSEYAILAPSRSGEGSSSSLGDRLKLTKAMAPELFGYLRID